MTAPTLAGEWRRLRLAGGPCALVRFAPRMGLPAEVLTEPARLLVGSDFLKLFALASGWIATPLICICTIIYIQHAISQPATNAFPMGLSAFGVTAALSGISFSMARACENPATAKYAGEKFLHSSILLSQTLLVLYIRDTVVESDWIKTWPNLVLTVSGLYAFHHVVC